MQIGYAAGRQVVAVHRLLNAFGDCFDPEGIGIGQQNTQKPLVGVVLGNAADERTVNFNNIHGQAFKLPKRCVLGSEIVKSDAAPQFTDGGYQTERLFEIVQLRRFGDLDRQAIGDLRTPPDEARQ